MVTIILKILAWRTEIDLLADKMATRQMKIKI